MFVLKDGFAFCPQDGFGVRLSHSSFNQIVGMSCHLVFTVWHCSVPNQFGNLEKHFELSPTDLSTKQEQLA